MPPIKKKLCYLVTEDWYFLSHRLDLAKAAQRQGYDVYVVTRVNKGGRDIELEGIKLIPLDMNRHGKNLINQILIIIRIIKIYRDINPDIVHHIALKPTLYGTLASVFSKISCVVNTVAGLGYIFKSEKKIDALISRLIMLLLKCVGYFKSSEYITQNPEDRNYLISNKIANKKNVHLIRGSGVDPKIYKPTQQSREIPSVLFASRLLWSKGIEDFVSAAEIIKNKNIPSCFILAGEPDSENPGSVSMSQLQEWDAKGFVRYIGHQNNMPALLANSDVVCLPTCYGEGVPKILIEAASCAIPIIATDVAGCKEIVKQGVNGYLIPMKDPGAIASALEQLLLNAELRIKMGAEGRRIMEEGFSMDKVNLETIEIYNNLFRQDGECVQ